jgi:hypothetical protein
MSLGRPLLVSLLALLAALPHPAAAVGEGEGKVALGLGGAYLTRRGFGPHVDLEGQYGLTDALSLHAAGALGWQGGPSPRMVTATAGLTYALDVLNVVPFGEAGLCFVGADGGNRALGLQVGLGLEYFYAPHANVMLAARFAYLPVHLGVEDGWVLAGGLLAFGYVF